MSQICTAHSVATSPMKLISIWNVISATEEFTLIIYSILTRYIVATLWASTDLDLLVEWNKQIGCVRWWVSSEGYFVMAPWCRDLIASGSNRITALSFHWFHMRKLHSEEWDSNLESSLTVPHCSFFSLFFISFFYKTGGSFSFVEAFNTNWL